MACKNPWQLKHCVCVYLQNGAVQTSHAEPAAAAAAAASGRSVLLLALPPTHAPPMHSPCPSHPRTHPPAAAAYPPTPPPTHLTLQPAGQPRGQAQPLLQPLDVHPGRHLRQEVQQGALQVQEGHGACARSAAGHSMAQVGQILTCFSLANPRVSWSQEEWPAALRRAPSGPPGQCSTQSKSDTPSKYGTAFRRGI